MVDEYIEGSITRLNPESTCPLVTLSGNKRTEVGGAFNVANAIYEFSGRCQLASIFGSNLDTTLTEPVDLVGINSNAIEIPIKTRITANGSTILRMDREPQIESNSLTEHQEKLYKSIPDHQYDLVVYSDYNKFAFRDSDIDFVKNVRARISVVDPKKLPIDKWKGCTVFKPNRSEAIALTGCDSVDEAAIKLLNYLQCQYVVTTLAEEGALICGDGMIERIPNPYTVAPANVSGAGDIFTASIGVALASGFTIQEAVKCGLAFCTYFVSVGKQQFLSFLQTPPTKLRSPSQLRNRSYKLVWTNGCFDILHAGHVDYLKKAASLGDKLAVGINSDESIKRLKGNNRPVNSLQDRIEVLSSLSCVDFIVPFITDTPIKAIEAIAPDIIVKGSDWKEKGIVGSEFAKEQVFIDLVPGRSTTNLACKISQL